MSLAGTSPVIKGGGRGERGKGKEKGERGRRKREREKVKGEGKWKKVSFPEQDKQPLYQRKNKEKCA